MSSRTVLRATAALVSGILVAGSLALTTPAFGAESTVGTQTTTLTGTITRIADAGAIDDSSRLFSVEGEGFVRLDFSAAKPGIRELEELTVRLAVPASVDLSGTRSEDFSALLDYTLEGTPLVVTEIVAAAKEGRVVSGQTNLTPAVAGVHRVFAVLVTPNGTGGTVAANQTAAKVQGAVNHVNSYWAEQSSGTIGFELAGVVPWYTDSAQCSTQGGSDALWAHAAARAKQLGYKPGPNVHLSLFFPTGTSCGSWLGLGSLGNSVNSGGVTWIIGSDQPRDYAAFAHEIGHNMSLGHANWQSCGAIDPRPGFGLSGCTVREYGDVTDVMGFGIEGKNGGALSSPNAIRAGIWNSSAYDVAPKGTNQFTLTAVSSNAGTRAVVVEDYDGTTYFVEYRNQTGEDAQFASNGCTAGQSCAASSPGIRIMRQAPDEFLYSQTGRYYKGIFWEGTDALTRGAAKPNWVAGESFNSSFGSTGFTVTVNSLNGATATVTVTRRANATSTGSLNIYATKSNDRYIRVGNTATVFMSNSWKGDNYTYQWYRYPSTKISGATKSSYTFTSADKGKCVKVKVTATGAGQTSRSVTTPSRYVDGYDCYGLVKAGILSQGTVAVDATSAHPTFTAVPSGWFDGPSIKYQWYRSSTATSSVSAIRGATRSTYTPTASDSGKFLLVKATASKRGYSATSVYSSRKNYTVTASGPVAVTGTAKVGVSLGISNNAVFTRQEANTVIASPTIARQWYASGKAISGATGTTFTPTAAQYGKTISVRVTGSTPGFASASVASPATAKTIKGTIAGSLSAATVTKTVPSGILLTASLGSGVVTETGVTYAYQWYRGTAAISKATKASYAPTASDYGQLVSVKVSVRKSGYDTAVIASTPVNHSVMANPVIPLISGHLNLGSELSVGTRSYTNGGVAAFQWYRNGTAIPGATANKYTTGEADRGRVITVKVVATAAGFLTSTATSAPTQKLATNEQQGATTAPTMTKDAPTVTFTAAPGVTETGVKAAYQWYRGTAAISKATKSTYKVTSADYGKDIKVRVTTTKADYTTVVAFSAAQSVSVMPVSLPRPTIDDTTPIVNQQLTALAPTYSQPTNPLVYQWYANGKAITGATESTFTVLSAQKGKAITVRVVASATGYLSSTLTSVATSRVSAL